MLVENHFKAVKTLKTKQNSNAEEDEEEKSKKTPSIVPLVIINAVINKLSKDPEVMKQQENARPGSQKKITFRTAVLMVISLSHQRKVLLYKDKKIIRQSLKYKNFIKNLEMKSLKLEPKIEGRSIRIENPEVTYKILISCLKF